MQRYGQIIKIKPDQVDDCKINKLPEMPQLSFFLRRL